MYFSSVLPKRRFEIYYEQIFDFTLNYIIQCIYLIDSQKMFEGKQNSIFYKISLKYRPSLIAF